MQVKKIFAIAVLLIGTSLTASAAHFDVGVVVGVPPPAPMVVGPVGVAPAPGSFGWTAIGIGWEAVGYGLEDGGFALPGLMRFGSLRTTILSAAAIIITAVTGVSGARLT